MPALIGAVYRRVLVGCRLYGGVSERVMIITESIFTSALKGSWKLRSTALRLL